MNGAEVLFPQPLAADVSRLIARATGGCCCCTGTCRLLAMVAEAEGRKRAAAQEDTRPAA